MAWFHPGLGGRGRRAWGVRAGPRGQARPDLVSARVLRAWGGTAVVGEGGEWAKGQARPSLVPGPQAPGPYFVLKHIMFGRQKNDIWQILKIYFKFGKCYIYYLHYGGQS